MFISKQSLAYISVIITLSIVTLIFLLIFDLILINLFVFHVFEWHVQSRHWLFIYLFFEVQMPVHFNNLIMLFQPQTTMDDWTMARILTLKWASADAKWIDNVIL